MVDKEMPKNIFMAKYFQRMFDESKEEMVTYDPKYRDIDIKDIKPNDIISAIVDERIHPAGYQCADRITRNISGMYKSFEEIVKNKYKDNPIFQYTPEMIKAVYATCIGSVQKSISDEAVLEVETILEAAKKVGLPIPGIESKGGEAR